MEGSSDGSGKALVLAVFIRHTSQSGCSHVGIPPQLSRDSAERAYVNTPQSTLAKHVFLSKNPYDAPNPATPSPSPSTKHPLPAPDSTPASSPPPRTPAPHKAQSP